VGFQSFNPENTSVQSLAHFDLSKLHGHLVFHSESPSEVRTKLSHILTEHDLNLGCGRVNTTLFRRKLEGISVMKLTYGAEIKVKAAPFKGFSLVQTPLRGSFEVEIDGSRKSFSAGDVAVLSPRCNLGIHWQQGSEQLIVKIPHSLLRRLPQAGSVQHHDDAVTFASPLFKLDDSLALLWYSLVQQAIDLPDGSAGAISRQWLEHFEQTIALFLLTHQVPGYPAVGGSAVALPSSGPTATNALDRMEAYIRQRLCAPISLIDLAHAAGLSPRSLNALCHKYHGISPMVLLRNMRLDAVRHTLQTSPGANVTSVALDHGFGHLGRFSAYYRERFGELPRDTISAGLLSQIISSR